MTTYKTVLYRFDGLNRVIERGLTLEEARAFCKHDDSSSKTCRDKKMLARWGSDPNNPWFIGYTEE